jgi:hypothetical protein
VLVARRRGTRLERPLLLEDGAEREADRRQEREQHCHQGGS